MLPVQKYEKVSNKEKTERLKLKTINFFTTFARKNALYAWQSRDVKHSRE